MSMWLIAFEDGEELTVASGSPLAALESVEHRGLGEVARIERVGAVFAQDLSDQAYSTLNVLRTATWLNGDDDIKAACREVAVYLEEMD